MKRRSRYRITSPTGEVFKMSWPFLDIPGVRDLRDLVKHDPAGAAAYAMTIIAFTDLSRWGGHSSAGDSGLGRLYSAVRGISWGPEHEDFSYYRDMLLADWRYPQVGMPEKDEDDMVGSSYALMQALERAPA